ncbi:hypothetical protein [Kistimonas asteriae]|uniref:hypothetical protein n=1 Tax=Kistimonas asteriae TaxID=517724 RepID=UPI001BAB5545|nr:hypothetical protein [Kistimonas asteriae]
MDRYSGQVSSQSVLSVHSCMEPQKTDTVVEVEPARGLSESSSLCPNKPLSAYNITLSPLKAFGNMVGSAHHVLGTAASVAKKTAQVSKAFVEDFAATTASTLSSALFSETAARMVGFTASLSQAGLALLDEVSGGLPVSVDAVTPLLRKADIEVSDMTPQELRQLSLSVAALHLGKSQTISLDNAKFRYHKPFTDYAIDISKVTLERLQPMKTGSKGTDAQMAFEAERLSMVLSYVPLNNGSANENASLKPTTVKLEIPVPKLSAKTNLLSLLGEYGANATALLKSYMPRHEAVDYQSLQHFMVDEKTGVAFTAKTVGIEILEHGSMLEGFAQQGDTDKNPTLLLHNPHFGQENLQFVGMRPMVDSQPVVGFGLAEMDNIQAGPMTLKNGYVYLDEQANGSLRFNLETNFKSLNEYCPEWLPKHLRKKVTASQDAERKCVLCIDLKIREGMLDLDRLWATGFNEGGVNLVQKLLTHCLLASLNSKKTRIAEDRLTVAVPVKPRGDLRSKPDDVLGIVPEGCHLEGNGDVAVTPKSHHAQLGQLKGLAAFLRSARDKIEKMDKKSEKIKQNIKKVKNKIKNSEKVTVNTWLPIPEETKAFRTVEGGRGKIDMFTLLAESGYDWGSKK